MQKNEIGLLHYIHTDPYMRHLQGRICKHQKITCNILWLYLYEFFKVRFSSDHSQENIHTNINIVHILNRKSENLHAKPLS